MAEKKKAYQRFQELTRQVTAPTAADAERDQGSAGGGGTGFPPGEALPIRLSPEVRRALEQQAVAKGTTPSEVVEQALRRYLETLR